MAHYVLVDEYHLNQHQLENLAVQGIKVILCWDSAHWQAKQYTLKRLVFIYERLCELPIDIYAGDTVEVLQQLTLCDDNPLTELTLFASKDKHEFARHQSIAQSMPTISIRQTPQTWLFESDEPPKLSRFFQYWKTAEAQLRRYKD